MVNNNIKEDIKTTQNKFFKSKTSGIENGEVAMEKKSVKIVKKRIKKKASLEYEAASSLEQTKTTTLSESLNRGYSRRRLRPRKNTVNYKDSSNISLILEKSISPDKRNSVVLLEKIDISKGNKKPIYKAVNPENDDNTEIIKKDKVYDFQFDTNDPREKNTKNKRKKKVTRNPAATRKKKTEILIKNNENGGTKIPLKSSKIELIRIDDKNRPTNPVIKDKKSSKEDLIPMEDRKGVIDRKKLEQIPLNIENAEENASARLADDEAMVNSPETLSPSREIEQNKPRVRISSVETLTGDRKVNFKPDLSPFRQSVTKFNPFRSTQSLFRPRSTMIVKDMMEHSLLNKSLSPIKGDQESNFDAASPWRPPLTNTFSSIKQVVQSTPQMKRNFMRKTQETGFRIDENDENDENIQRKDSPVAKSSGEKPRNPLGVKILNAENIQLSTSKTKDPVLVRETNPSTSYFGLVRNPLGIASNYGENKKNLGFGDRLYISPKKNDKATTSHGSGTSQVSRKKNTLLGSRGKITEELLPQKKVPVVNEDENLPPIEEQKILKQSNLNSFLNVNEMPESITTTTGQGLFGDAHSTPIVKTKTSRILKEPNIDNCFGFDDDSGSDNEISPIKVDDKENRKDTPNKKTFDRLKRRDLSNEKQRAARISLGEIKNILYPKRERKFGKLESIEEIKKKNRREAHAGNDNNNDNKRQKIGDTFDVLFENEKQEDKDKSFGNDVGIFADLEPVHFTKPPRWSYSKRRERKQHCGSSSDEIEEDSEEHEVPKKPVLKKRKMTKNEKKDTEKINAWVKSVNETFQEIDDFDLVVEKLP